MLKYVSCIAVLIGLCSGTALAEPTIEPKTETERLLLEMIRKQGERIEALENQVERLSGDAEAGEKPAAVKRESDRPEDAIANERIDEVEANVDELENVMQTRVSQVEARTQDGKTVLTTPGPRWESPSGDFSVQLVGAIQADAAGFDQSDRGDANTKLHGGTNIRRLHTGLQGTAYRNFNYTLVFDVAASSVQASVRDANVQFTGLRPFTLTLGQQKPQVGLEPNFSDRSNASTFMEQGLPVNLITAFGTRQIGARVSSGNEHYSASIGVFGEDVANNNVSSPITEGWGPAGRVTIAPINMPGAVVHAGLSGYWREVGRGGGAPAGNPGFQLRYRAQSEVTVDSTRLVDTGLMGFADSLGLLGFDSAGVYGPFSVQGEYVNAWVEQEGGRPSMHFDGAYAFASWFITGESRVYDGRTGTFVRTIPKQNFSLSKPGWGAFELALRWSYLDLNADPNTWIDDMTLGGVRGGNLEDWTVGFNWYLNPYLRLMLNYVRADAENFTVPAMLGPGVDEGTVADVYAVRVHQEW